jgi:hypothetical protein
MTVCQSESADAEYIVTGLTLSFQSPPAARAQFLLDKLHLYDAKC